MIPRQAKLFDSRSGRVGGLAVFKTLFSSTQRHTHRGTVWPLLEWMCLLGVVKPRVPRVLTAATLNWYQRPGRMSESLAPRCVVCEGSGGSVGGRETWNESTGSERDKILMIISQHKVWGITECAVYTQKHSQLGHRTTSRKCQVLKCANSWTRSQGVFIKLFDVSPGK